MSNTINPVTTPGPMQITLDLTCALVTNGMFRFRTVDSQGRLDELLQFIAANAPKVESSLSTAAPAATRSPPGV